MSCMVSGSLLFVHIDDSSEPLFQLKIRYLSDKNTNQLHLKADSCVCVRAIFFSVQIEQQNIGDIESSLLHSRIAASGCFFMSAQQVNAVFI